MYIGLNWIANNTNLSSVSYVGGLLVSGLASVGTYISISKILKHILGSSTTLTRYVLGPSFIEGTWIGFLQDEDVTDRVYLVTEQYEQDLENIVIRGSAYTLDGQLNSSWTSKMCNLDPKKGKIIYNFECSSNKKGITFEGVGEFKLCRHSKTEPAALIEGNVYDFVSDSSRSSIVYEKKLKAGQADHKVLFQYAKSYYEEHVNSFK